MSSLRFKIKRRRGNEQQEEIAKQQHVIEIEKKSYLKVLLHNVFEITIRSSSAILTVASHGIPYAVEDGPGVPSTVTSFLLQLVKSSER